MPSATSIRMSCAALICLAAVSAAVRPASAQCPDGTPPPCARSARAAAPSPNSVAVLYLTNLSRDTAGAFLADGLTEEIIIRLGQVPRLDVKSPFELERVRNLATRDPAVRSRWRGPTRPWGTWIAGSSG